MFINKKSYHLQMKLLCIFTISFCLSGCISRLSRPEMTGQVVDTVGKPIANVQVGEVETDQNGYFQLKERRYYAFFLKEMMYMEAPPVFVRKRVFKPNFQTCDLQYFNRFGGGQRKGAKLVVGKVILHSSLNEKEQNEINDCDVKTR